MTILGNATLLLALCLLAVAQGQAGAFVKVDIYLEIGCPVCDQLLTAMEQGLPQYASTMQIELHPFGNSFYATQRCEQFMRNEWMLAYPKQNVSQAEWMLAYPKQHPAANPDGRYDVAARKCWDDSCGAAAVQKDADCFTGPLICQHGVPACGLQSYALAAKELAGANWQQSFNFTACLDKNFATAAQYGWPDGALDAVTKDCAAKSGIAFGHLKQKVKSEGDQLTAKEAALTVEHTVVPLIYVSGTPLESTNFAAGGLKMGGAFTDPLAEIASAQFPARKLKEVIV